MWLVGSDQVTVMTKWTNASLKQEPGWAQEDDREEWRKKKELEELEEQRKLGNTPPEMDEEGKDINLYIPWYTDPSNRPTLKHERWQTEIGKQHSAVGGWYRRGLQENIVITKLCKGASRNCGPLTHKKKDCLVRPRKVGAKNPHSAVAPDERSQYSLTLTMM